MKEDNSYTLPHETYLGHLIGRIYVYEYIHTYEYNNKEPSERRGGGYLFC